MVAYQPGKAANMAAAATISQTSLPSHSGPIVLMAARRPASSAPTRSCSMPTPKSNPSRMKNPVQRMAMMVNQNGMRGFIAGALVLDGRDGLIGLVGGTGGRELFAGVLQHQDQVDCAEDAVEHDEPDQADPQPGSGQGG